MAFVSTRLWLPRPLEYNQDGYEFFRLFRTGEKFAWIFQAPKAGELDWFEFRTGAVTTWTDVKLSFQGIAATGNPDETPVETVVVTANPGANSWVTPPSALLDAGNKRSVTRGQLLVCLAEFDSTVGDFQVAASQGPEIATAFPNQQHKVGVTPVWVIVRSENVFALKYADGSYGWLPHAQPALDAQGSLLINTSTTPDLAGARFRLKWPVKVSGVWIGHTRVAGGDFRVILVPATWDGSEGQILAKTPTLDAEWSTWTAGGNNRYSEHFFTSEATLSKDTWYRLLYEPLTVTDLRTRFCSVASAARLDGFELGQNFHWTTAKDPTGDASFTNDLTKHPWMRLLVTGVEAG